MSIITISGKINNGKDAVGDIINYLTREEVYKDFSFEDYQDELIPYQPYTTKKFADKLKDTICLWLGCTRKQLEDRDFKEKELGEEWWRYIFDDGSTMPFINSVYNEETTELVKDYLVKLTPRKLLQLLGTDCGRNIIHPNIWINATMSDYKDTDNWIITDCRFPNEAESVISKKGITIRVNRPIWNRFPKLWKIFFEQENSVGKCDEVHFLKWLHHFDIDMWKKLTHESETALDTYDKFSHFITNDGTFEELIEKVRKILVQEGIL